MTSEQPPKAKRRVSRPDFSAIQNAADANAAKADAPDIQDLESRLATLEVLAERLGIADRYLQEFNAYCGSLRKDQEALTLIRWLALWSALALVLLIFGGLAYFMFWRAALFWIISDAAKATIIVAGIGGAIAIVLVILRGSFRTIAERNKDDVVPEHLKTILEAANAVLGRNK